MFSKSPQSGEVFIAKSGQTERFFQVIGKDEINLNSSVTVVFTTAPDNEDGDINEIALRPIDFYCHTRLEEGIKSDAWHSLGVAPINVDLATLRFKYYRNIVDIKVSRQAAYKTNDMKLLPPFDEPYWDIWKFGDNHFQSVDYETGCSMTAEDGRIYSPKNLLKKICSAEC